MSQVGLSLLVNYDGLVLTNCSVIEISDFFFFHATSWINPSLQGRILTTLVHKLISEFQGIQFNIMTAIITTYHGTSPVSPPLTAIVIANNKLVTMYCNVPQFRWTFPTSFLHCLHVFHFLNVFKAVDICVIKHSEAGPYRPSVNWNKQVVILNSIKTIGYKKK